MTFYYELFSTQSSVPLTLHRRIDALKNTALVLLAEVPGGRDHGPRAAHSRLPGNSVHQHERFAAATFATCDANGTPIEMRMMYRIS